MKKAIYRMERGAMIYLFSGKCPVPDERGGFSLDNLPPGFNFADNDSTRVFAKIIDGLPKIVSFHSFVTFANCASIDGKKYGFCKVCTNAEAILLVSCLNLVGLLGKWMGAKVFLCNISGSALHHVYNGRKRGTEKFSGIDKSLFEVVSHLSNCVSHRRMESPNLPNNLRSMIDDDALEMVVDLNSPDYQVPKSVKELKKEASD
ncbi:hypothetical protein ACHAWO_010571 [Cyclotella atomus]|uniref:Uncharacterized protein n=1 Tax=Cyclotella atomus TaxID=382360 RepID=A0ABD3PDP3_9STRA